MMLSKRQFASAVGATEKWVDNAGRILGRRLSRTPSDARWLGLVREITQTFETTLVRAGELATRAIQLDPHSPPTPIAASRDGALRLVVDLERYHSRFGVALAAALLDERHHRGPPAPRAQRVATSPSTVLLGAAARGASVIRLRAFASLSPAARVAALGEPVREMLCGLVRSGVACVVIGDVAAVARGVPRARARLEVCYASDSCVPARLADLLVEWNARPLDVDGDYPFVPDPQTVADAPVLALATRLAAVVLRRVARAEFAALVEVSEVLDFGTVRAPVLGLPALIAALRNTRLPTPPSAIPELEAAAALMNRVDLNP